MVTHRIHLEQDAHPSLESQIRLTHIMQEVVHVEILKLLDVGVIYPISDNKWVNPIQVVPKKSSIIIVKNEHDEMVPTHV